VKRLIVALSVVGCFALLPAGAAQADCDTPGDFGAGSGCPPPGSDSSGGGGTESWPPTSVDWPPLFESALGGGDTDKAKAPPIVAAGSGPASTSTTPTTTSTPIVMPGN